MSSVYSVLKKHATQMHSTSNQYSSPNEAVNFDLGCIFIAVPKTGTTSIRSQVRSRGPYMIDNPHLTISQIQSIFYPYFLKCSLGRNNNFPFSGEVESDSSVREKSRKLFSKMFKFGSVRNPWARTFSLYRRKEGIQVSSQISFSEFVGAICCASETCVHPLKTVSQLDWFRDENGMVVMDYIFKLEEIGKACEEIRELTGGRVILDNQRRNVNPMKASYKDAYTLKDRKLVEKLFQEEIDFFGYIF